MLEQVEAALQRRDYRTASNILTKMAEKQPNDFQVKLYSGKLQEATNQLEDAEQIYRQLMQDDLVDPKILQAARQGIKRIRAARSAKIETLRKSATQDFIANESKTDDPAAGMLILEPVAAAEKTAMALKFAQIMKIDPYNARLLLPSRSSRVYRTGNMGEMSFYEHLLQASGIPAFALSINQLNQPEIIQVKSIESFRPKARITALNGYGTDFSRSYHWSEVKTVVQGLIPIFEEITETTAATTKTKVQYKSQILDYVQVWDLHLPRIQVILRICSQNYAFALGEKKAGIVSNRENWQRLIEKIREHIPNIQHWNEFTPFAETALDYPDTLEKMPAHLQLVRRQPSNWDQAFQLYSGAIFSRHLSSSAVEPELN
jgi:Tetratricopeptide repeat